MISLGLRDAFSGPHQNTVPDIWEFPQIRGTFLGIPIIRIIGILGSILGSPYFGKLPYSAPYKHGTNI